MFRLLGKDVFMRRVLSKLGVTGSEEVRRAATIFVNARDEIALRRRKKDRDVSQKMS